MAYTEDLAAVPLLRQKVCAGDPDPLVTSVAMEALLQLAPEPGLILAERWLQASEERAEAVAMALGTLRRPAACSLLRWWGEKFPQWRATAYLAMAMTRQESAVVYLLECLALKEVDVARDALDALAMLRHDSRLVERVRSAVRERTDSGGLSLDSW